MWNDNDETRRGDDWKQWKSGWQYKGDAPHDPVWISDRNRLFKKNGNGWWITYRMR
jgi:hypothetical protein